MYLSLSTQIVVGKLGPVLASVCLVDYSGNTILDVLVLPTDDVIDYLTEGTGFLPSHFVPSDDVLDFSVARQRVEDHVCGQILVGFELWMSLQSLQLDHPAAQTRDLATYHPILPILTQVDDGLRDLADRFLGKSIHCGYENTTEDSQTAMSLYHILEDEWESSISMNLWPCILPPPEFSEWYT